MLLILLVFLQIIHFEVIQLPFIQFGYNLCTCASVQFDEILFFLVCFQNFLYNPSSEVLAAHWLPVIESSRSFWNTRFLSSPSTKQSYHNSIVCQCEKVERTTMWGLILLQFSFGVCILNLIFRVSKKSCKMLICVVF